MVGGFVQNCLSEAAGMRKKFFSGHYQIIINKKVTGGYDTEAIMVLKLIQ